MEPETGLEGSVIRLRQSPEPAFFPQRELFRGHPVGSCAAVVFSLPAGGILAAAHLGTSAFVEVERAARDNDLDGARVAWSTVAPLIPLLFAEPNPMPIKHCLWRVGLIASPECRLPLTRISEAHAQALDNAVASTHALA
jgi:hypothetical protein